MKINKLIIIFILIAAFLFVDKGFVNAQDEMGVPDSGGDSGGVNSNYIPPPGSTNNTNKTPSTTTSTGTTSTGTTTGSSTGSTTGGSYVPPYVPPAGSGGISASIGGGTPFSMDTPVGIASDTTTSTAPCFSAGARYDTNSDNVVSQKDLNALLQAYLSIGTSTAPLTDSQKLLDINGDGKIDPTDFSVLYAHYGQHACASPTPTGIVCAEVITSARNSSTHACQTFPTACLPTGWTSDQSCAGTPIPTQSCALKPHGDANCDGVINTDDFNIWRDSFLLGLNPSATPPPSFLKADFNGNGGVDTDDFNIWRDGFLSNNSPVSTPTPNVTAIPLPTNPPACPTADPATCSANGTWTRTGITVINGVTCYHYKCTNPTPTKSPSPTPTPIPTIACTPKPTGCGTFWDFVNPTCKKPAGSAWCTSTSITPTPTTHN